MHPFPVIALGSVKINRFFLENIKGDRKCIKEQVQQNKVMPACNPIRGSLEGEEQPPGASEYGRA